MIHYGYLPFMHTEAAPAYTGLTCTSTHFNEDYWTPFGGSIEWNALTSKWDILSTDSILVEVGTWVEAYRPGYLIVTINVGSLGGLSIVTGRCVVIDASDIIIGDEPFYSVTDNEDVTINIPIAYLADDIVGIGVQEFGADPGKNLSCIQFTDTNVGFAANQIQSSSGILGVYPDVELTVEWNAVFSRWDLNGNYGSVDLLNMPIYVLATAAADCLFMSVALIGTGIGSFDFATELDIVAYNNVGGVIGSGDGLYTPLTNGDTLAYITITLNAAFVGSWQFYVQAFLYTARV